MDRSSHSKRKEEAEITREVSGYSDFLGHESLNDGLQRGTTLTNSFTLDSWLNIPRNKISNDSEEVYDLPIARAKVETTINPEVPATLRISTAEQQLNSLLSVENMMNSLNMDSSSYNGSPYITAEEDNDDLLNGGTFGDLNSANLNVDDINSLLGEEGDAFQHGDQVEQNYYVAPPAALQQQQQRQEQQKQQHQNMEQQMMYQVDPSQLYTQSIPFSQTVNSDGNVSGNNNELPYFQIPKLSQTTSTNVMPLTPQIIVSPEDQAKKTPSLFSSRESSRSRSNSQAPQLNFPFLDDNTTEANAGDNPSANILNVPNSNYDSMRRGRQRRHSHSSRETRSRSGSVASQPLSDYDDEYFSGLSSGYEDNFEEDYEDDNHLSQNGSARYVCDICQKEFNRPYNLKSHQRTHTKERPFACKKCGKTFARQHDRKRHEDLHSGQKRFQCKGLLSNGQWGCGKRFARPDALRRHFFTESGKNCIKQCVIESIGAGSGSQWETSGVKAAMVNATQYQKSIQPSK